MVGWALSLVGLVGAARAADCVEGEPAAAMEALARSIEQDYVAGEDTSFAAGVDALHRRLPCTGELLSTALVAHLHQVFGLAAMAEGRAGLADASFAAARAADPASSWPSAFLPDGHVVDRAYEQALTASGAREAVPSPRGLDVYVDGRIARDVLQAAPAFVQLVDRDGAVIATRYREPDTTPVAPDAVVERGKAGGWFAGAGGALLASAGLYAAGALVNQRVGDTVAEAREGTGEEAPGAAELRADARWGNGLVLAAGGLGVVGTGLCAVAVVRVAW